ncbi:hypothetical protein SNARM312S_05989 [Streptomyces narbonensis]
MWSGRRRRPGRRGCRRRRAPGWPCASAPSLVGGLRVPAGDVRALEGAAGAAGAVDDGLGDAAEHGGDADGVALPAGAAVLPLRREAAEGVEEGLGALAEHGGDAAVVAAGLVAGPAGLFGVLAGVLDGRDVDGAAVTCPAEAGVEEIGEPVTGDGVGPDEGDPAAGLGELDAVAGDEGGLSAVDGVGERAGELVLRDAVAADVRDAGGFQRAEERAAVLAVRADHRDSALSGGAAGAGGGAGAGVLFVAGEDSEFVAVDAALGVHPAGVGLRHGGHAGHVGRSGLVGGPGHHRDGLPGAPRGSREHATPGEQ